MWGPNMIEHFKRKKKKKHEHSLQEHRKDHVMTQQEGSIYNARGSTTRHEWAIWGP